MEVLPYRRRLTLKSSSPLYFQDFLSRRWADDDKSVAGCSTISGIVVTREAFPTWNVFFLNGDAGSVPKRDGGKRPSRESLAIDLATGWQISPVVAAALCMKPTPMLTHSQAVAVAVLKDASPSFVVMRRLTMCFRGLLRSANPGKLGSWLDDARHSGIGPLQQFARTLSRDIDAVRNAIAEPWSSGQVEGQINRLKPLKWAMFGRAGIKLLRERMLPLE